MYMYLENLADLLENLAHNSPTLPIFDVNMDVYPGNRDNALKNDCGVTHTVLCVQMYGMHT